MRPKGGPGYDNEVIIPKVWEEIEENGTTQTYLLPKGVSNYIRSLEEQVKQLTERQKQF